MISKHLPIIGTISRSNQYHTYVVLYGIIYLLQASWKQRTFTWAKAAAFMISAILWYKASLWTTTFSDVSLTTISFWTNPTLTILGARVSSFSAANWYPTSWKLWVSARSWASWFKDNFLKIDQKPWKIFFVCLVQSPPPSIRRWSSVFFLYYVRTTTHKLS